MWNQLELALRRACFSSCGLQVRLSSPSFRSSALRAIHVPRRLDSSETSTFSERLRVNVAARSVKFDGKIDQFPAFDAYATINDGLGIMLFQESPPAGNTIMNLPGTANRPIVKTITFP